MEYLPLFLLFMAALIAGYFYLEKAKKRDAAKGSADTTVAPSTESTDESH
ncbi:MAG: hypothetical protein K5924_12405 [Chloroflexi bacterium]|nr:hypothetical protein [Chloroflexota bacterium]